MNKKYAKVQSTRRSLIMSVLSLMLCIAMLIGTTYAWFTDSVTSGKNQIKAGNLDVALYHNGTDEIDENTDNLFNVDLWEPGVICYENFKVVNEGNLALKYAFSLNISDKNSFNNHDLSEVIKVAVVENGFNPTGTTPEAKRAEAQTLTFGTLADFQKIGHLDTKNASETYGVVLYWEPTNNDDLYNVNNYTGEIPTSDHQPLFVEFGINLFATQYTYESDSFDNQYDATAEYPATEPEEPIGPPTPPSPPESGTVVDEAGVKDALLSGEPVKLGGDVTIDVSDVDISHANINLDGHTLSFIDEKEMRDPTTDINIHGGKVNFTTAGGNLGVYAGKISFSDCTIVVEQGAVITEAMASTTISFNNVVFDCRSDAPAIFIGKDDTLTMTNCSKVAGSKDIFVFWNLAIPTSIPVNGSTVTLPDGGGNVSLPVAA